MVPYRICLSGVICRGLAVAVPHGRSRMHWMCVYNTTDRTRIRHEFGTFLRPEVLAAQATPYHYGFSTHLGCSFLPPGCYHTRRQAAASTPSEKQMTSDKHQDGRGARVLESRITIEELLKRLPPMDSGMRSTLLQARRNATSCGLPLAEYILRALRHRSAPPRGQRSPS